MIKKLISGIRAKWSSLYVGLFRNIFLGILLGITVYALVQLVSGSYIRFNYASPERRDQRESEQVASLRDYVIDNEVTRDDVVKVAEWASERRYLYLMLYDGNRLIYTSDLGVIPSEGTIPESSGTVVSSGLTVDHPTNAELRELAVENGIVKIVLAEGELYASVYDYSEYMHYDLINILSIVLAFVALAFIIINYFGNIVKRVRRLEADVTIVTHSSMEHKIAKRGSDEIGRLSTNIENMRQAILDNLQREREARDSNTELITAMSHDIRTPLTVLLGYLEMMKSEARDMPVMKEYIEASERTAMRLKLLSDDMFKYSLAFGGSIEGIDMQEYDANLLFEQMLTEHVLLLRENGYAVEINVELEELPPAAVVVTDAQNLMRIMDNIFSNVRKYADIAKPISINVKRCGAAKLLFECANTVRTDTYKAESNKIGLKTCARLARIIAESFEYGVDGEKFSARLVIPFELPESECAEPESENNVQSAKNSKIYDLLQSIGGFFKGTYEKLASAAKAIFKKNDSTAEGRSYSKSAITHIKPIEPAAQENKEASHGEENPSDAEIKETGEASAEELAHEALAKDAEKTTCKAPEAEERAEQTV